MKYLGDFPADQAIYFAWNTNDSDGASITRATDGTISVYKDASNGTAFNVTQVTTGITNDEDFDGLTGIHTCCITTTNAWYEIGHDYMVVLSASTINAQAVNVVLAEFSIENRHMVGTNSAATAAALTTHDGKLDTVDTNVDSILTDTGTTIPGTITTIDNEIATIDANVDSILADTDDIGVAGAGLTAVPWNSTWDSEVQSECNDALIALKLDHLIAVADADDVVNDSVIAKMAAIGGDWSTFVKGDDSLQAIRDRGDAEWTTGAGGSAPTVGEIRAEMEGAGYKLAVIEADTNELQTDWKNTGRLDNLLDAIPTTAMRGTNSVPTNPLLTNDGRLDHLDAAISSRNATTPPTVTEIKNKVEEGGSKLATIEGYTDKIDDATNGLTAIKAEVEGLGGAAMVGTNGANTTTPPTVGEIRSEMEGIGSKILAIESDTNELQGDWKNAGRLDALLDAIPTTPMRGTDGVSLVIPDASGTAAGLHATTDGLITTVDGIVDNIVSDTNELQLAQGAWATATGFATLNEYDLQFESVRTLLGSVGNIFYVSKSGDDGDGTTWAKAKTTIDAAIALCTANNGDQIFIDAGTYDESANGAAGVACDVEGIWIKGVFPGVHVKNTDVTNGGKVLTITASNTLVSNIEVNKGETTSENSICIDVNGAGVVADIRDTVLQVEKASHTGLRFTGGCHHSTYMTGEEHLAHIFSVAHIGTAIEFGECETCIVIAPMIHEVGTAVKFTGGVNCNNNKISVNTCILNCTLGVEYGVDVFNNIVSALILNCTDEYENNSGNNTNKTDGSLSYVLDDIKTHLDNGLDEIQGAGFVEATDSLEAIRNQGDSAWLTATTTALSAQGKLDVNVECDTALSDYGANTTTPPTVGEIDTKLATEHGAGDWTTGGGAAAPTVDEIDTKLTAEHGAGDWITGAGAAPTVGEIRDEMEKAGTKLTEVLIDTGTTIPDSIKKHDKKMTVFIVGGV